jgi:hypothetical protein
MDRRRKADLSILARNWFDTADLGVLGRHAAPEPTVNTLNTDKQATPPRLRVRDRFGFDDAAERLGTLDIHERSVLTEPAEARPIKMEFEDYVQAGAKSNGHGASNLFAQPLPAQKTLFPENDKAKPMFKVYYDFGSPYSVAKREIVGKTDEFRENDKSPHEDPRVLAALANVASSSMKKTSQDRHNAARAMQEAVAAAVKPKPTTNQKRPLSTAYGSSMPPHMSEDGESRNRSRRGDLPRAATDILRSWFQKHLDHPYPSDNEKQMLIMQTGISMNQVWHNCISSMLLLTRNRSVTGSSMLEGSVCQPCFWPEITAPPTKPKQKRCQRQSTTRIVPCTLPTPFLKTELGQQKR